MTGRKNSIRKAASACLFAIATTLSLAAQPAAAQTSDAAPDPFTRCVAQGVGEPACLARLGEQFDWHPTEAACRFLDGKTEAIITAGGDVRWRDLFYNERCARHGLPYGETAAKAGDAINPEHPYLQCTKTLFSAECDEEFGQHSKHPRKGWCYMGRNDLRDDRKGNELSIWYTLFENERCWRLGLPYYEEK